MVWNYIKERMLKTPNSRISEDDINISMTYKEAVEFAENQAKNLTEPCYSILCQNELNAGLALLSCLAAGVTAVPLSFRYGDIHWRKIVDHIKPSAIITDISKEQNITVLKEDNDVTKQDKSKQDKTQYRAYLDELQHDKSSNKRTNQQESQHTALIMCTSGTTGQPKGAMITSENLLTNIKDIETYFDIGEQDRILITRPLYHCAVLTGEFLISLVKGTNIIFKSGSFEPQKILELLKSREITVMCGTPTLFQMLERFLRRKSETLKLRCAAISGECLGRENAQIIRKLLPETKIYHVYGLTEASPRVLWLPPEYFDEYSEYAGIPLPSLNVKIVDCNGKEASPGEKGELCINGKSIMKGYYNAPEMTHKVLKNTWLLTGDIAVANEMGFIKILCRKDDLIIKAGMNIYPQEIENALQCDPRVEEVIAYSINDEVCGARIGLKVKGSFNSNDELLKLCGQLLPSYQQPSKVELVSELPKNISGKKIRKIDRINEKNNK